MTQNNPPNPPPPSEGRSHFNAADDYARMIANTDPAAAGIIHALLAIACAVSSTAGAAWFAADALGSPNTKPVGPRHAEPDDPATTTVLPPQQQPNATQVMPAATSSWGDVR